MNKLDKFFMKYIIGATPCIIALFIIDSFSISTSTGVMKHINDILGWVLMSWIAITLFIICKMVINQSFRKLILLRFSGIKESDERESYISGEAAKFSLLSTAAGLLLFMFLSIFEITVAEYPDNLKGPGKNGYITINMSPALFHNDINQNKTITEGPVIFKYNGFPLTNLSLILILVVWMFGSYRIHIYREYSD